MRNSKISTLKNDVISKEVPAPFIIIVVIFFPCCAATAEVNDLSRFPEANGSLKLLCNHFCSFLLSLEMSVFVCCCFEAINRILQCAMIKQNDDENLLRRIMRTRVIKKANSSKVEVQFGKSKLFAFRYR